MKVFSFNTEDSTCLEYVNNICSTIEGADSKRITRQHARGVKEIIERFLVLKAPVHKQLGKKACFFKENDRGSLVLYRGYKRKPRRINSLWHQSEEDLEETCVTRIPSEALFSFSQSEFYEGQRLYYFSRSMWDKC